MNRETMVEVAEILGVSADTVCNWEQHRTVPALQAVPRIVCYLGYNPTPRPSTMAERLKRFRHLRGLTQGKLAQDLGVDQSTLARWERGEREPKGRFLERVEQVLKPADTMRAR